MIIGGDTVSPALQNGRHASLEGTGHDAEDDRIQRAVRMTEQKEEGQHRQRQLRLVVVVVDEIQVETDDVVGQPRHGKQRGDDDQHLGETPSARHYAVAAAAAALLPAAAGPPAVAPRRILPPEGLVAGEEVSTDPRVGGDDDGPGDDVDDGEDEQVVGETEAGERVPALVTEGKSNAVGQVVALQSANDGQREHDSRRRRPDDDQTGLDRRRREETTGGEGVTNGEEAFDAQGCNRQHAGRYRNA